LRAFLRPFLENQRRRLRVFFVAECLAQSALIFGFVGVAIKSLAFFLFSLRGLSIFEKYSSPLSLLMGALAAVGFFVWQVRKVRALQLSHAARRVERDSSYFQGSRKSELVSAAVFLEKEENVSLTDFENAHLQRMEAENSLEWKKLGPHRSLVLSVCAALVVVLSFQQFYRHLHLVVPNRIVDLSVRSFEELLPTEGAKWVKKNGSLATVTGAKIRFLAPESLLLQNYIFVKEESKPWVYERCDAYCEWLVKDRAVIAVGNIFSRSPSIPIQANPDESPKSVILVKQGSELIPNATVQIRNQNFLDTQILATDDLELRKVDVLHQFEDQEETLARFEPKANRFTKDFHLDLSKWKGGQHRVILRAYDLIQSKDSLPLTLIYLDEEFLRQERIRSLQELLNEWVHVLGDLLETQADGKVASALPGRLGGMQYPDRLEDAAFRIFVEGLKRLQKRIQTSILDRNDLRQLPPVIDQTEKQILYGLSLLFKERAGDVKSSVSAMQHTQKSLQSMLEEIKKSGKMDSSALDALFKQLEEQIKDLQNKMKNLPQGPQDDLINRQAMEDQIEESNKLQEKIAEIQKQLQDGKNEQAMKELQSLINQLSILNKEMERSFNQWQENLDRGAAESAKKYQEQLQKIQERQEQLAKKTRDLSEAMKKSSSSSEFDPSQMKQREQQKQDLAEAKKEQQGIGKQMDEASEQFKKSLEGSEWESLLRSGELQEMEESVKDKMSESSEALERRRVPDSEQSQLEAVELLKQMGQKMEQSQQQLQQMGSSPQEGGEQGRLSERTEVIESEGKGQKEKRRKIMEALKQQVDEKYKKSHERYFEDLLQR